MSPTRPGRTLILVLPALLAAAGVVSAARQESVPSPQTAAEQTPAMGGPGEQPQMGALTPLPGDVPVTLDGEVLYYVRRPLGPFGTAERARRAEELILHIARDPFYSPDLIRIAAVDDRAVVYYRDDQVGAISPEDAASWNETPMHLAEMTVQTVKEAIARFHENHRPKAWLKGGLILLLASVGLALAILGLQRLHRRMVQRMREDKHEGDGGVLAKTLGVHARRILEFKVRLLGWGLGLSILVAALIYLQLAFWALPFTHGLALGILHYVTAPLSMIRSGFLAHVADLFFIAVLVVLLRLVLKLMRWLADEATAGTITLPLVTPETALAAYKVSRIVVFAIFGMMVYPYIPGSSSAAFKGIGLFAGALFTLGASATANSLIGGVTLIFTDVYRLGDRVRIGNVQGEVIEITLLITRVRTTKNEIVAFSNGGVLADRVINFSKEARGRGLILHTSVTIGYNAPWRQVHELLEQAARATEGIEHDPAPFVLQTSLDDFYVSYQLNAITRNANAMQSIYSELHGRIQDEFNAAGVEIMSPHYAAHRDGATSTVPADQRPPDEPRPFVVKVLPDGAS